MQNGVNFLENHKKRSKIDYKVNKIFDRKKCSGFLAFPKPALTRRWFLIILTLKLLCLAEGANRVNNYWRARVIISAVQNVLHKLDIARSVLKKKKSGAAVAEPKFPS